MITSHCVPLNTESHEIQFNVITFHEMNTLLQFNVLFCAEYGNILNSHTNIWSFLMLFIANSLSFRLYYTYTHILLLCTA